MKSILIAVLFLQCTSGFARTVYFTGEAASNFGVDLTSFWSSQDSGIYQAYTGTATFSLANFGCRVFIYNPSPNDQKVRVSTGYIDQVFDFPLPQAGTPLGATNMNPWSVSGTAVSYTARVSSSVTAMKFDSFADGAVGTDVSALTDVTLSNGQALILENIVPYRIQVEYENGWLKNSLTIHPFVKANHICSGSITVEDANVNSPGFVIASGEQDFLAGSYQQPALPQASVVFRGSSILPATWQVPGTGAGLVLAAGGVVSWSRNSVIAAADTAKLASTGSWASCDGVTPALFSSQLFSETAGVASCHADAYVDNAITHSVYRSSFALSAVMHKAPIIINGGSPI